MKKHPRGAILSLALVLTLAGLITMPREGAAYRMRWEDPGPWTTGDPNTPDGGRAREVQPGDWALVPVQTQFGFLGLIAVPSFGDFHSMRPSTSSHVMNRP